MENKSKRLQSLDLLAEIMSKVMRHRDSEVVQYIDNNIGATSKRKMLAEVKDAAELDGRSYRAIVRSYALLSRSQPEKTYNFLSGYQMSNKNPKENMAILLLYSINQLREEDRDIIRKGDKKWTKD